MLVGRLGISNGTLLCAWMQEKVTATQQVQVSHTHTHTQPVITTRLHLGFYPCGFVRWRVLYSPFNCFILVLINLCVCCLWRYPSMCCSWHVGAVNHATRQGLYAGFTKQFSGVKLNVASASATIHANLINGELKVLVFYHLIPGLLQNVSSISGYFGMDITSKESF